MTVKYASVPSVTIKICANNRSDSHYSLITQQIIILASKSSTLINILYVSIKPARQWNFMTINCSIIWLIGNGANLLP